MPRKRRRKKQAFLIGPGGSAVSRQSARTKPGSNPNKPTERNPPRPKQAHTLRKPRSPHLNQHPTATALRGRIVPAYTAEMSPRSAKADLSGILDKPPPSFDERVRYGSDANQFAELRYPKGKGTFPLLFVVHGGFWQSVYDLRHIGALCAALTGRGIITCSLEYRRLGDPGGGWPGTFRDVTQATSHILETTRSDPRFSHARTAIQGHSAGGHLALWLTGSHRIPQTSPLHTAQKQPVTTAISLAGITDLRAAWKQQLGHGTVTRLMGERQTSTQTVTTPPVRLSSSPQGRNKSLCMEQPMTLSLFHSPKRTSRKPDNSATKPASLSSTVSATSN